MKGLAERSPHMVVGEGGEEGARGGRKRREVAREQKNRFWKYRIWGLISAA